MTSVPIAPITVKQSCSSATFTSCGVRPAIAYAFDMAVRAPSALSTSRSARSRLSVACA